MSAVFGHLPIGSIVEYLDDQKLGGSDADVWTDYLLAGIVPTDDETQQPHEHGWCVDEDRFWGELKCRIYFFTECECSDTRTRFNDTAAPQLPCRKTTLVQFAPVLSESNSTAIRCISAYPLMTTKTQDCPCRIQGQICVKPKREEQILRIQWSDASAIQRGDSNHERVVVLWSGEKRDIWESVQVSSWMPRFGLVGKTTIGAFEVLFE